MEPSSFSIIDSHVHFAWPILHDSLTDVLKATGADGVCLAALPGCSRLDPTLDILAYKTEHAATTFALGCLDCTVYGQAKQPGKAFVKDAKRLMEMGCDGIKLLEGKPTMRRTYPIPDFDDPAMDPFFAFAEETRLPLLWHVNDPETFWNPSLLPVFARQAGWGYGPQDIDNEAQYRQVRNVLTRHPALNVTFAHMFFLSAQLVRLEEWLDRFPGMRVDLTPGIELYENLSQTPEETRAFFNRFQDRIQYGTDIGGRAVLNGAATRLNENESRLRAKYCKAFLSSNASLGIRADGDFLIQSEPFVLHGLGLPEEMQKKIYRDNFLSFIGKKQPAPVNRDACIRDCHRLRRTLRAFARRTGVQADLRAADADLAFFEREPS
jgi:hypothetical protein